MKLIYSENFNIDLGLLNYLHPFDGTKFRKIIAELASTEVLTPETGISMDEVDEFLTSMMRVKVRDEVFVFRALEVPKIPFVSFNFLDRKILTPMRWAVAGTKLGATLALQQGGLYWNLAGGYHHAHKASMEGFCIYNDIGISVVQLLKQGLLSEQDKILIIDTDAHHGNGNAFTFMENPNVTLLDVYNADIYPRSDFTRERVNIPVPLASGCQGQEYLSRYQTALSQLENDYKLAFVVAGTDVLKEDKLGGLMLNKDDVAQREAITLTALKERNIPGVILGGGGYSKLSAPAVANAIKHCLSLGF